MFDLEKLRKEYEAAEGRVKHAYQDHLGYWTIGIGFLIDKRKGGGLRDNEIDFIFANRIRETEEELDRALPWWRGENEVRQKAMLDLAYQMGVPTLLGFKNTLRDWQRGDYKAAAAGLRASKLYQQTPARTERRARMIETGQD